MGKTDRLSKIIELVNNNEIETQAELVNLLNESGFQATQTTVSRDIKELRLEKKLSGRKSIYTYPESKYVDSQKYIRVFTDGFSKVDQAGNFVVIKTVSGMAMAVAASLEHLNFKQVVGTIAGDDTIMCATKSENDAAHMIDEIHVLIRNFGE